MNKTLVIVGSYTPTRVLFDFARTDCDIWVFNEAVSADWCKRADAVFQMHEDVIWRNPANRNDPNHVNWLRNQNATCNICSGKSVLPDGGKCPRCQNGTYMPPANRMETTVYMQAQNEDVPNSKTYPLDGILEMLGDTKNHFLTSSVPQALALAAYIGMYERIEIYGVGMNTNTEYQFQREGFTFWLGFLKGRGFDVAFFGDTFEAPLYGYDGAATIEYERFGERVSELQPLIDAHANEYITARMKLQQAMMCLEREGSKKAQDDVLKYAQTLLDISEQLGMLDGAKQENERYQKRADVMLKETGKFIFSRQEFEGNLVQLRQKASQADAEFISAATTLSHIERNAMQAAKGSPKRANLFQAYREQMESYCKHHNRAAILKGAAQENANYMTYLDKHIRAAGGAKSEAVMLEALQNA